MAGRIGVGGGGSWRDHHASKDGVQAVIIQQRNLRENAPSV